VTSTQDLAADQPLSPEISIARAPIRVLCLGNDILADDALGSIVAERLREFALEGVEVVSTTDTGFYLFDYVSNTSCLVVIDTVVTGASAPGTIYELEEKDFKTTPGGSQHYIGLQETLALVRALNYQVPEIIKVFAVEAADCLTVGGIMHPAVHAAIPVLLDKVRQTMEFAKMPHGRTAEVA
jgi:hydrogenase maturation protease